MITLFAGGMLIILAYAGKKISKGINHPSVVMCFIWGMGLILIKLAEFEPISFDTLQVYLIWIAMFWGAGLLGSNVVKPTDRDSTKIIPVKLNEKYLNFSAFLVLLSTPFFLWFYVSAIGGSLGEILSLSRQRALEGQSVLADMNFFFRKLPMIATSLTVLYAYIYANKYELTNLNKVMLGSLFFATLSIILIDGARAGVLVLLIMVFFINFDTHKVSLRGMAYAGILVFFTFSLPMILMEKTVSLSDGYYEALRQALDTLVYYYLSGPVAFGYVLNNPSSFQLPYYVTLNGFFDIINLIGLDSGSNFSHGISIGLDSSRYIFLSFSGGYRSGNIYSIFYPYINDFGFFGGLIVFCLVGFLSGVIYSFRRTYYGIFLYCYTMINVVLSPFSEYFLTYIWLIIYILFFAFLLRKRKINVL